MRRSARTRSPSVCALLLGVTAVVCAAALALAACPRQQGPGEAEDPGGRPQEGELGGVTPKKPEREPEAPRVPAKSEDGLRFARLERFSSAGEFDTYVDRAREAWLRSIDSLRGRARPQGSTAGAPAQAAAPTSASSSPETGAESITNNQESGVDEGDIVKAAGEYFVILRRGRLFSVRQSEAGRPVLVPSGRCNAFPPGGSRGSWYDEMLLYRDRIVVIGFSYNVGATEVGLFRLGRDGGITHEATHFLRSNDYYSSRNYASRLVGGKLIFYMPYYLHMHRQTGVDLPAVTAWQAEKRRAAPWKPILSKMDVYRPIQRTLSPTLHTMVQCDLKRPTFRCSARAVVGPYSRTFYVSRDAVYIWVAPFRAYWGQPDDRAQERDRAHVYRMPILEGGVTAIRARGNPIDQFSFQERAGRLAVLLTAQGGGDAMFQPERSSRGGMALLRVPVASFSDVPATAADWRYTAVPRPHKGYSLQNRFVGEWVLWGAGAGWGQSVENGGQVLATHVRRPAEVISLSLDHGVDRIEPLGSNAMVVGSGKSDLFFTSVALGDTAAVRSTWVRANAAQGETRSHGFFFLPGGDGGGMLGLPVRTRGAPYRHLLHGSAEVVFLRVDPSLKLAPLGSLAARAGSAVNDRCVVSCVDWYGNARPIFFRGRIFALLGYELVEGALDGDALHERARTIFLTPQISRR